MLSQLATFMYANRWWLKVRKRYETHFKLKTFNVLEKWYKLTSLVLNHWTVKSIDFT